MPNVVPPVPILISVTFVFYRGVWAGACASLHNGGRFKILVLQSCHWNRAVIHACLCAWRIRSCLNSIGVQEPRLGISHASPWRIPCVICMCALIITRVIKSAMHRYCAPAGRAPRIRIYYIYCKSGLFNPPRYVRSRLVTYASTYPYSLVNCVSCMLLS